MQAEPGRPCIPRALAGSSRPTWVWASSLFLFAFALRVLFWQATPDAAWPGSVWYQGDAETWVAWSAAIRQQLPFEVALPIRPPGAAYLIAWLGGGGTPFDLSVLKLLWCALGAGLAPLVYVAIRTQFGPRPAWIAGLYCAASSGLMMLATSLNNETPYLFLVAGILALWGPVRNRSSASALIAWSAAHAAACLLRVEHFLFFVLVSSYLLVAWGRAGTGRRPWIRAVARLALSALVFAAVSAPWHAKAWAEIRRFNTEPMRTDAASERALQQVEGAVSHVRWSGEARSRLQPLPAAVRRNAAAFIAATVAVRGGLEVTGDPLRYLDEAFGARPRPLAARPFVALYGGLNFYLANNPDATGGFSRAPLERAPPLVGGARRYPLALVAGLPPSQLTLSYPPHLEIVNRGYALGWDWIREHPGAYARLAAEKARRFWRGAALGFGGYGLPLGLSGLRQRVDLVTPQGSSIATAWRLGLLVLCGLGLWAGRRAEAIAPWLAFGLCKLVITLAFFGYARQGATVVPVVALLVALALEYLTRKVRTRGAERPSSRWPARAVVAGMALLVGLEAARWAAGPGVRVDGRAIEAGDPRSSNDHRDRWIEVR